MRSVVRTGLMLGAVSAVAALAGCATHPMNSPEQIQNLVTAFNTACQNAGGATGSASRQGSHAICTKDGVSADLYIHADFILIDSRRNVAAADRVQVAIKSTCTSKNGGYTPPYRMVGARLIDDPNNKAICRVGNSWLGETQLVKQDNEYTLNAGVQRSPQGAPKGSVYVKDLNLALELTLFK